MILRVVTPNGQPVHLQPVTLAPGRPAWGEATIRVPPLEPGRYTVEAYFESFEDGSVQALDDHEITVR